MLADESQGLTLFSGEINSALLPVNECAKARVV
jgi:hypothetical protein